MLYTLYATDTNYDLELFHTKDHDEAMKLGSIFGKLRKHIVVWNYGYVDPKPVKMKRIALYIAEDDGSQETLLGQFDEQGEFAINKAL